MLDTVTLGDKTGEAPTLTEADPREPGRGHQGDWTLGLARPTGALLRPVILLRYR